MTWVCGAGFGKESSSFVRVLLLPSEHRWLSWNRHSWPRKNTSFTQLF